jgi:hypothetical protein
MPTQSLAKSHTCLSSEGKSINSSTQNKNVKQNCQRPGFCSDFCSCHGKRDTSEIWEGRGSEIPSSNKMCTQKKVSSSHAGGCPTGTRIQSMFGCSIVTNPQGREIIFEELNVFLTVHHSVSVQWSQRDALCIQFIENQRPLYISSITCPSTGGATQTAFGILRSSATVPQATDIRTHYTKCRLWSASWGGASNARNM